MTKDNTRATHRPCAVSHFLLFLLYLCDFTKWFTAVSTRSFYSIHSSDAEKKQNQFPDLLWMNRNLKIQNIKGVILTHLVLCPPVHSVSLLYFPNSDVFSFYSPSLDPLSVLHKVVVFIHVWTSD